MQRATKMGLCAAIALLLLTPLTGCSYHVLRIVIPDFETSLVEGVQVWRLDDYSQQPVAGGLLTFSPVYQVNGQEVVDYTQVRADGSTGMTIFARLDRSEADPNSVNLDLYYERLENPGWYKVSTFNSQGTSALSLAQTFL